VTPTRQRALNLCAKLEKGGLPFKRFWFADLSAASVGEPAKILAKASFTPKGFEEGALYRLGDSGLNPYGKSRRIATDSRLSDEAASYQ
jgi:hypothetical protein